MLFPVCIIKQTKDKVYNNTGWFTADLSTQTKLNLWQHGEQCTEEIVVYINQRHVGKLYNGEEIIIYTYKGEY